MSGQELKLNPSQVDTTLTAESSPLRQPVVVFVVTPEPKKPKHPSQQKRAKQVLIGFLLFYVVMTLAVNFAISGRWLFVRDPEYAARRDRLLAKQKAFPDRPIVLALGSSRMVEGLNVAPFESTGKISKKLILNGGMVGSGSILELMTYRRLKADGLKPSEVWLEYWPPLLRGDNHAEFGRIDLPRLGPGDWPIVRDYFPDPKSAGRYLAEGQLWPVWRYRKSLLAGISAKWSPMAKHEQRFATGMDEWGFWPGPLDDAVVLEKKNPFTPYLENYSVGEQADRALRDLMTECQSDHVKVTLIFLPESETFQSLYSSEANERWQKHLQAIQMQFKDVELINMRNGKYNLPDGVHLSQKGATQLTKDLLQSLKLFD